MAKAPDSFTAEETIRRKQNAERILSDPIMIEAFERTDQSFVEDWRRSSNPQEREAAWAKVHALAEVQRTLREIVAAGDFEEVKIEKRKEEAQREEEILKQRTSIRRS